MRKCKQTKYSLSLIVYKGMNLLEWIEHSLSSEYLFDTKNRTIYSYLTYKPIALQERKHEKYHNCECRISIVYCVKPIAIPIYVEKEN